MKTLLISEIFPPRVGGSGQWFWEIYRRQRAGEYAILAGHCEDDERFDQADNTLELSRAQLSSDSWSLMNLDGIRYYWRLFMRVRQEVRKKDIKRLHCARVMPEGVVAMAANKVLGIPYDCYVHGEDIELARQSRESRWLCTQVIRNTDTLICNSHNSKRLLTEHWPTRESQRVVMHPGVDTARFAPPENLASLRQTLGWNNRTVILTVSRLEKRKGHDVLLQSLAEIRKSVPDVLYAIVGSGEEQAALESLVVELGVTDAVTFHGAADDDQLLAYYQGCDIFVLPNRQHGSSIEGFGIVLLEAQACQKPVIGGDSGGTVETMLPGTTGQIVDCTSADALARSITSLLGDPKGKACMGKSAREHMVQTFSWDSLGQRADTLFKSRLR